MENQTKTSHQLVTEAYEAYRKIVMLYIYRKIDSWDDAEDLTQDAFLRLLDYHALLHADTIKSFLFTIVRNLVNDYLRRHYKWQEISSYVYEMSPVGDVEGESRVMAADLEHQEKTRLSMLPPQRRLVYEMSRFEDKSVSDIAVSLNLSVRTVENHLFIGRREIREFIKKCI